MLKVLGTEVREEADGRSLLDEIAHEGARRMLVAALEDEVAAYLEAHSDERDGDGHALVVRNGRARTRKVTVGLLMALQAPRHGAGPVATARRHPPPAPRAGRNRVRGRRTADDEAARTERSRGLNRVRIHPRTSAPCE
jgi:hypothetical protein